MIHSRPFLELSLRRDVYDYDGYRCVNCGSGQLTLDHIKPRVLGGPDTFDNLQTLCSLCNSRKGCAPFVPPMKAKEPKPSKPPGVNWRLHVPKAMRKLPSLKPRRQRNWERFAEKYPHVFTSDQPVYRKRERLRLADLVSVVRSDQVMSFADAGASMLVYDGGRWPRVRTPERSEGERGI